MTGATELRERPILFSGAMVRALLDGSKTQTRRVVRSPFFGRDVYTADRWTLAAHPGGGWWGIDVPNLPAAKMEGYAKKDGHGFRCPYGQLGDLLWVRETWGTGGCFPWPFGYRADGKEYQGEKWRPSIFMPRAACRIKLKITEVRVQRLQSISHEDVLAEGIDRCNSSSVIMARERYEKLWNGLNAKRGYGWDINPWVWAITFAVVRP